MVELGALGCKVSWGVLARRLLASPLCILFQAGDGRDL
jgi:hypothetical protein